MPGTSILKPFQSLGAASALVLMTGFSVAHLPGQRNAAPAFRSAHVVSATDVPYPMQSIAIGTVVLEVTVSETGQVENVLPIREIDSLTEVATDSVKNWQFTSASLDGKPMRSRTTVAVTFNPAAIPAANVPLPPVSPKAHSRDRTLPPHPTRRVRWQTGECFRRSSVCISAASSSAERPSLTSGRRILRPCWDKKRSVSECLQRIRRTILPRTWPWPTRRWVSAAS